MSAAGGGTDPADGLPFDPARVPVKATAPEGAGTFAALDLRVGRVLEVDPFPEARRPAYKLSVDFGPLGVRRTSAQITDAYRPADLVGRLVVGAVNLGSRRIAGFESQFLVLGGHEPDGTVRLLQPDADLPPGAVVA